MPELPEVESVSRGLSKMIVGQKIIKVEVTYPKIVSASGTKRVESSDKLNEFIHELQHETIKRITRRAKNILIEMNSGKTIIIHLKMTGQLVYIPFVSNSTKTNSALPSKHTHIVITLERGTLFFNDMRKFGHVLYFGSFDLAVAALEFQKLGLEPLDNTFTLYKFRTLLKQTNAPVKKMFLDQRAVVGLGNIYSDEVCFDANIRPTRRTSTLKPKEITQLYTSIKHILSKAVELGGSSISDYILADGTRGGYTAEHKVYGRAGLPCYTCGTTLVKVQLAGRTTVYCPNDQK